MAHPWYTIRARAPKASASSAAARASSAEIYIYGDIGERWWDDESVTASSLVRELSELEADAITVRINSIGGSVSDGVAIYNALRRHPASITCVVDGVAASIASLIAMAGDTVEMASNAMLMLHAPWTYAGGNANDMRATADMLDAHAQAMATSYAAKSGKSVDDVLSLWLDGEDHWLTAEQAQAEGLADLITDPLPVAASLRVPAARFKSLPAAAAAFIQEPSVPQTIHSAATPTPASPASSAASPAAPAMPDVQAAVQAALTAEGKRRSDIRAAAQPFLADPAVRAYLDQAEGDASISPAAAGLQILALVGKSAQPIGGRVEITEDERDKTLAAMEQAILARAGVRDEKGLIRAEGANPFRGWSLVDMARASMRRAGMNPDGLDKMALVGAAFDPRSVMAAGLQGTTDFPILLENALNKSVQAAYAVTADTWSRFCRTGSVTDFRAHNRYRVGSLGNFQTVNEHGEFRRVAIPDGERSSITAGTKGLIVSITRQMVINDDLQAFNDIGTMIGRAGRRSVEVDVYAMLALNSGAGPTMPDSNPFFHSSRGNVVATGVINSVTSWDAMRILMARQLDVGANDFLDLRPAVWLGPVEQGGLARTINDAQYDTEVSNKFQVPNRVRGLVRDIVDTPRLSGNAYYLFADPTEAPAFEVAFLDGQSTPFLELQNGFTVDGASFKGRLDYGVAPIDPRGAVRNPGA